MNYSAAEQKELIRQANEANTYICGADGKLCGHPREMKVFPCQQCKRNKHWKNTDSTKRKITKARSLCEDPYNNADYGGPLHVKFKKISNTFYYEICNQA